MQIENYLEELNLKKLFTCPFTNQEISELEKTNEMLVYLSADLSAQELCKIFGIRTNIDFENEKMIRNVMINEEQWFITSANEVPELMNKSGRYSRRIYEARGLHGMDLRRYLAFVGEFKHRYRKFPDQQYWTFLLSGSYDRSGTSIAGFDKNGILSHHGWMDDFKKQFVGSRYVVLPPRIELNSETTSIVRAYR